MRSIKCVKNLKSLECEVYVDVYILTICGLSPPCSPWSCLCNAGDCGGCFNRHHLLSLSDLRPPRVTGSSLWRCSGARDQPWFKMRPGVFWVAYILNNSNECHTLGTLASVLLHWYCKEFILLTPCRYNLSDKIRVVLSRVWWPGQYPCKESHCDIVRPDNYNTVSCLGHSSGHCLMLWCLMSSPQ